MDINGSNITEIPEYAFRPIMGQQWNLKELTITGPIQRIDNFAFYDMPYWMRNITLGSLINHVSAHAFDMRVASYERLTIDLSDNILITSSFETGAFMDAKRPLFINLARNQITHLEEQIFLPLINLDIYNQINLDGNPLECNCHIMWLLKDKSKYERQVLNAVCINGKPLWDHSLDEVSECVEHETIISITD